MPTPPPDDHATRIAAHLATAQRDGAAPVVFPQIHDNGSGAKQLATASHVVLSAIDAAIDAEWRDYPNARDYPDAADLAAAKVQAEGRIATLGKVRAERQAMFDHCRNAMRERA